MRLTAKKVFKNFGKEQILKGIDFSIEDGEFVSILGPTGCGKTTLLNVISGIYEPDYGDIIYGNRNLKLIKSKNRNIGYVFQDYSLFDHMDVFKNIAYPLKNSGVDKATIISRIDVIANILKINPLLKKYPEELSGGQKQRVAIARAFVKKPDILLLDEPFANLDKSLRHEMRKELKMIQTQTNTTTILVTHDQEEALSLSDRIMILDRGHIKQFDEPHGLYNNPIDMEVAMFVGTNPITIFDGDNIPGTKENLWVGVRPEDFIIIDKKADKTKRSPKIAQEMRDGYGIQNSSDSVLSVTITSVLYRGDKLEVAFEFGNQPGTLITDGHRKISFGETLEIRYMHHMEFAKSDSKNVHYLENEHDKEMYELNNPIDHDVDEEEDEVPEEDVKKEIKEEKRENKLDKKQDKLEYKNSKLEKKMKKLIERNKDLKNENTLVEEMPPIVEGISPKEDISNLTKMIEDINENDELDNDSDDGVNANDELDSIEENNSTEDNENQGEDTKSHKNKEN